MQPKITQAEAQVLQALVEQGEATTKAVHQTLVGVTDWAHPTVVTFLRRLEAKGLVTHRRKKGERAFHYSPTRRGKSAGKYQLKELIDRVFGGDALPLVSTLLEEKALKPEQIAELRRLLDAHAEREGEAE